MILSRRIAMENEWLDELDDSIVIQSVKPGVANKTVNSVSRMSGTGHRITEERWDPMETAVTFAIDLPKRELKARQEVFDKVVTWASRKGMIRVNSKTNKYLYVEQTTIEGGFDFWDWTKEYTITFKAYSIPFWQSNRITGNFVSQDNYGTQNKAELPVVGGDMKTVVDLTITNNSGATIPTIEITTERESRNVISTLKLQNVKFQSGQYITVHHGDDGVLRIRRYKSDGSYDAIMECVSSDSSDDLFITPGANRTILVNTSRSVAVSYGYRGRFIS